MAGRAFVFGDEINTDVITPNEYVFEPLDEQANHIMEPIRPDFADELEAGDFIVAGEHFGSGSSRERAPGAIKTAGIEAVVAESFSRIFYRNSVALGLPAVTCPDVTSHVEEGDELSVDLTDGIVTNVTTGEELQAEPLPEAIQGIFDAGGLIAHFNQRSGGLKEEIE